MECVIGTNAVKKNLVVEEQFITEEKEKIKMVFVQNNGGSMEITFVCKTSGEECDYPYVNTATFKKRNGEFVVIDREITEYDYDETRNELTMWWRGIYIWDGKKENFDVSDDYLLNCELYELDIDDDAPKDYRCECDTCYVETDSMIYDIVVIH